MQLNFAFASRHLLQFKQFIEFKSQNTVTYQTIRKFNNETTSST